MKRRLAVSVQALGIGFVFQEKLDNLSPHGDVDPGQHEALDGQVEHAGKSVAQLFDAEEIAEDSTEPFAFRRIEFGHFEQSDDQQIDFPHDQHFPHGVLIADRWQ